MKFRVMFKDPDGPMDSIQEAATEYVNSLTGIDEDDKESLIESRVEKIKKVTDKFFEYGEYVELEVDTDAKTCVVIPCGH